MCILYTITVLHPSPYNVHPTWLVPFVTRNVSYGCCLPSFEMSEPVDSLKKYRSSSFRLIPSTFSFGRSEGKVPSLNADSTKSRDSTQQFFS